MTKPDFVLSLRRANEALSRVEVSPSLYTRIVAKAEERNDRGFRRFTVPALVTAVALGAVALGGVWFAKTSLRNFASRGSSTAAFVGGFEVTQGTLKAGTVTEPKGHRLRFDCNSCTLTDHETRTELLVKGPLELERSPGALRVVKGAVDVHVEHRQNHEAPMRFRVSHGTIDVLGTRFRIDQGDAGGSVVLREGAIRFRSDLGTEVTLAPGQSVAWPLPEPKPASTLVVQSQEPTAPSTTTKPTISERLENVEGLRSRGQWARAASELSSLLHEPLPRTTRERLSYELGSIYTYQMVQPKRACAHWATHERTYPKGRYRAEIEGAERSLGCARTEP
jgi:transmembrane sensor